MIYTNLSKTALSPSTQMTLVYILPQKKKSKILEKKINDDLKSLFQWFSNNQLLLNINKCQYMMIGTKGNLRRFNDVKVMIQNMKLERVSQCKYLGVLLDSNFTWTPQIYQVKKKALKTFHSLKRVRQYLDKRSSLLLYQTLIQPQLDYCSLIWMNGHATQLARLQTLQIRCLRLRSCLFCEGRISVLKRWFKTPIQNAVHGSTVYASLEKKTISWACTAHCSRSSEPERRLYDVI